eukprot:5503504-Prymnesium_polylepis.1
MGRCAAAHPCRSPKIKLPRAAAMNSCAHSRPCVWPRPFVRRTPARRCRVGNCHGHGLEHNGWLARRSA